MVNLLILYVVAHFVHMYADERLHFWNLQTIVKRIKGTMITQGFCNRNSDILIFLPLQRQAFIQGSNNL